MIETSEANESNAARPLMRFSNREAQERWSGPVTTRGGMKIFVRPARSGDRTALERFFEQVSEEDLYFRFLSGIRKIDDARIEAMLCDTDDQSIDFLALDETGEVVATAMLVADHEFDTAEFALSTRADMKGRGISWALLDFAMRYAQAMGIRRLRSLQSASQADALQLEREMGFAVATCPDDATLMLAERTF